MSLLSTQAWAPAPISTQAARPCHAASLGTSSYWYSTSEALPRCERQHQQLGLTMLEAWVTAAVDATLVRPCHAAVMGGGSYWYSASKPLPLHNHGQQHLFAFLYQSWVAAAINTLLVRVHLLANLGGQPVRPRHTTLQAQVLADYYTHQYHMAHLPECLAYFTAGCHFLFCFRRSKEITQNAI